MRAQICTAKDHNSLELLVSDSGFNRQTGTVRRVMPDIARSNCFRSIYEFSSTTRCTLFTHPRDFDYGSWYRCHERFLRNVLDPFSMLSPDVPTARSFVNAFRCVRNEETSGIATTKRSYRNLLGYCSMRRSGPSQNVVVIFVYLHTKPTCDN
jgi:hypothetical protein